MAPSTYLIGGAGLCLAATAVGLITIPALIRGLRWLGAGKQIRAEGPASHQSKAGTPSMGGLIFVAIIALLGQGFLAEHDASVGMLTALLLAASALGAYDDLLSSARFRKGGLRARPKLAWQAGIAAGAVILELIGPGLPAQHIPGLGMLTAAWAIAPLAVLAIIAAGHAVNLTDGLDGLAAGTNCIALAAFAVIAFSQGQGAIGAYCLLAIGALAGFLWYNVHPARLFMGDTGSLALGSLLGGLALVTGQIVALIPIGAVFVAEALSVIIQVTYFKRTGGKRIFKMAPLHHHFEQLGWPETQIVQRFWLAAGLAAVVGLAVALYG
ncbi:MAG TPA: phospho-N-acetylmuramoyl-pentapeptide-transferase [Chloroflexota bacterium]|nr:phospho-N-acetylmuramoyl-pentapeptide-transferase [Chloroflexota bacterium]